MLANPLLTGSAAAVPLRGLDDLGALLQSQFLVHDLEALRPAAEASPWRVSTAALFFGDVGLTSIEGSALTVALEPLVPHCTLALPSAGWGEYRIDDDRVECIHGQSLAFLPAHSWRLTNDCSGGTGVHASEQALLGRLLAMTASPMAEAFLARLRQPRAIHLAEPSQSPAFQQLLFALHWVEHAVLSTGEPPHPHLNLDDLILRSIALLLVPELLQPGEPVTVQPALRRAVRELMDWMLAHLHLPLSLSEIEQRSHYGRRALQQGFKREVGLGPMQWLRQQRLQQAFAELQHPAPNLTVSAVAQRCGYLSLASFSRDFGQRFRITPSALLRQARGPKH